MVGYKKTSAIFQAKAFMQKQFPVASARHLHPEYFIQTRKLILVDVNLKTLLTVIASVMFYAVLIGKRRPQDVDAELILTHVFTSLHNKIRENRDD